MNQKDKALVMLIYSEILHNRMLTTYSNEIRETLDICWNWIEMEKILGEDIYSCLDDGTDFGGIYIYMQMDTNEDNILSWDNISYAISYVDYLAYKKNEKTFVPAPIENIDDSVYDLFISNLDCIDTELLQYLEQILNFVESQAVSKKATIEFLKSLLLI
ncbi:Imm6 family immunity protein [Streptococcus plurextorum]